MAAASSVSRSSTTKTSPGDRPATTKGDTDELAGTHGAFRPDSLADLHRLPLQQLWLDHLLALQLRANPEDGWDEGTFVLLSPTGNIHCTRAAQRYRSCLSDPASSVPLAGSGRAAGLTPPGPAKTICRQRG